MKKTPTLFTWLFSAPFKFSLMAFAASILTIFIYSAIISKNTVSNIPLFLLISLATIICIYFMVRKLPRIKMDQPSFIAIHNAQTILLFCMFAASTFLLTHYQHSLLILSTTNPTAFLCVVTCIALYLLFLMCTSIINFYVKICRIQQFNIPAWKILLSWPFGFGMLWTPGYLLKTKTPKKPSQEIQSNIYSKITNWTLASSTNTIAMFVFTILVSSFFVGMAPMLLTFSMALIFGLWVKSTGTKKFEKQMPKTYSTFAIIVNFAMIIAISCFYVFAPAPNISISISDTSVISTQGQ